MQQLFRDMKPYLIATIAVGAVSAIFHGLAFTGILPWSITYSDVYGFYEKAVEAGFPYITKFIEYPVLTGLFIHGMGALGGSTAGYYIWSALLLIAAAVAGTALLFRTANDEQRKRLRRYWIFAPTMLVFAVYNWDLLAVLTVIAAFYFLDKKNFQAAFMLLAIAASFKFYPGIYFLPFLFAIPSLRERIASAAVFAGTLLAVNLPFALINFKGWSYFFALNNLRNSNPDSIWTLFRYFFPSLTVSQINYISLVLFAAGYIYIVWRFRKTSPMAACFAATILFLLTNKVFTPQYLLWLLPFFVWLGVSARWFYILEFANFAVLFAVLHWFSGARDPYGVLYFVLPFVAVRHIALGAILARIRPVIDAKQPVRI